MSIHQREVLQVKDCSSVMKRFRQEHKHEAQLRFLREIIQEVDYSLCIYLEEKGAKHLCSHLEVIKAGLNSIFAKQD